MQTSRKFYYPYIGLYDPCPPLRVKSYETPPQLYMGFQPYNLPQFYPREALIHGTLWPALFAPYDNPYEALCRDENGDDSTNEAGDAALPTLDLDRDHQHQERKEESENREGKGESE